MDKEQKEQELKQLNDTNLFLDRIAIPVGLVDVVAYGANCLDGNNLTVLALILAGGLTTYSTLLYFKTQQRIQFLENDNN